MMTNTRAQAHANVALWIIALRSVGVSVRDLLASAEELYEEGSMTRAEYRIAIYELTMMEERR